MRTYQIVRLTCDSPHPRAGLAPMAVGAGARLTAGHAGQALCLLLWGDRIDPGDV
jgi:hypothetical protein